MIKYLLRPRDGVLVVGLVSVALLAGCTSASVRAPAPPPTHRVLVSASSSPSPTPSLDHKAVVIAAARAYFTAMDVAMRTGETADLLTTTARSCPCRDFIAFAKSIHKQGRVVGATTTVSDVSYSGEADNFSTVDLRVVLSPFRVLGPSGVVVTQGGRESARYSVLVAPIAGKWLVYNIIKVGA
jgi:hypothetical protein